MLIDSAGYSEWAAEGPVRNMIINELAKRMSQCRDEEIWSNLTDDITTPGVTITSEVSCSDGVIAGSCCTFTYNLYNSIVTAMKRMQAAAYEPDYVIMNPEVAAYLYFKSADGYPIMALAGTTFSEDGKLLTVAGLKVVESCNATLCNANGANQGNHQMAVLIDSKRAVGEAWGKKPTFTQEYVPECDTTKIVIWQYWGSAHLDPNAVGWIVNP